MGAEEGQGSRRESLSKKSTRGPAGGQGGRRGTARRTQGAEGAG